MYVVSDDSRHLSAYISKLRVYNCLGICFQILCFQANDIPDQNINKPERYTTHKNEAQARRLTVTISGLAESKLSRNLTTALMHRYSDTFIKWCN